MTDKQWDHAAEHLAKLGKPWPKTTKPEPKKTEIRQPCERMATRKIENRSHKGDLMATNDHAAKSKSHLLRPNVSTASRPAASVNKSRPPNTKKDGIQPGSHIDRQAKKNWNSGRDDRSRDK